MGETGSMISASEPVESSPFVSVHELQQAVAGFRSAIAQMKAISDALAGSMDAIDVKDEASNALAARELQEAQLVRKKITQLVKPVKDVLNDAKAGVLGKEKDALLALNFADSKLRAAMLAYKHLREGKHRIAQAQLQREHLKLDEDSRWAEVMALREEGRDQEADQLLEYQSVSAPVVLPEVKDPAGFSVTRTWKARCNSLMTLICAIAAGKESIKAVKEDQAYLDKQARAQQETFAIAGCEAYPVEGTQVREAK